MKYDGVVYYMDDPHDLDEKVKRFVTVVEAYSRNDAFDRVFEAFEASGICRATLNWYARAQDAVQRERDDSEDEVLDQQIRAKFQQQTIAQ